MARVTLDSSGDLYYEEHGSGPALVFVHGLGGNHLSWWQQVPHFQSRFRCIAFAHRGFSPSGGSAEPERFADELAALLDHLDVESAVLVGQSLGGWTCLEFALREPDRVRALVLANTTGTLDFGERFNRAGPAGIEALQARGIHPGAGARMRVEQPKLYHLFLAIDALSERLDRDEVARRALELRNRPPEAAAGTTFPVLWILSEEDAYFDPALAGAVQAAFPEHRVELVPATGHCVYFERADVFNGIVDRFLGVTGATGSDDAAGPG